MYSVGVRASELQVLRRPSQGEMRRPNATTPTMYFFRLQRTCTGCRATNNAYPEVIDLSCLQKDRNETYLFVTYFRNPDNGRTTVTRDDISHAALLQFYLMHQCWIEDDRDAVESDQQPHLHPILVVLGHHGDGV